MNDIASSLRLRKAISLGIAALIVVALIVAVGFGLYFSTGLNAGKGSTTSFNPGGTSTFSTQTTVTKTSSSENYPTSANTTNSTLGLELVLSTNTTAIMSGQEINVSVDIFNTLSTVNNVTGASNWAIPSIHDATSFPCPTYLYYQVYPGYYTATNISSATSLQLSPVEQYLSCPIFQRSYYLIQPHSSIASIPVGISTVNSSILYQNVEMSVTSDLIGNYSTEYNASVFTPNGALPPPAFRPGTYTLAAGDEWGQLVILHFSVEPNPMTTTTYSTSNSSTFAGETLNSTSGLRLDLFLALSDGSVVINVDEYNTLDTSNNVSAANHWRYFPNALSPYNDCGASGPLGFAVFQGYYDSSNYTSGTALALYNTTYAMSCTATLYPTTSYVFNPQSDVATAYNAVGPVSPFETNASVSLSFTTYGYWTGGLDSGRAASYQSYASGNYTVLAANEWGQIVLEHFEISGTRTTYSSISSQTSTTSYGCTTTTTTFVNVTVTQTATECLQ